MTCEYLGIDSPACEIGDFDDGLNIVRQMGQDCLEFVVLEKPFSDIAVANFAMCGFVATLPDLTPSTSILETALSSLLMVEFAALWA